MKFGRNEAGRPYLGKIVIKCFVIVFMVTLLAIVVFGKLIFAKMSPEIDYINYDINYTKMVVENMVQSGTPLENEEDRFLMYFLVDNSDVMLKLDKECIADCSKKIYMNLEFEKKDYICDWSSDEDTFEELSKYCHDTNFLYRYRVEIDSYYCNKSADTRYPCDVSVYKVGSLIPNKSLVKKYHLTPINPVYFGEVISDDGFGVDNLYVSADGIDEFYQSYEIYDSNNETHVLEFYINHDQAVGIIKARVFVALIILVLSLIAISFVIGLCLYFSAKYKYEIRENNRVTTEAMAHDLKTPLSVISVYAEALEDYLEVDIDQCKKYTKNIRDNVFFMNNIIANILSYSNSFKGSKPNKYEKVNVREEISKYLEIIAPSIAASDLKINLTGEAMLTTDIKIWNQSIYNIIENAVKYAIPGSEINISLSNSSVTISNQVESDVKDTDKLIKPFVKGETSRSSVDGNGLGLSIVDNNLKKLGYKLSIDCKDKVFVVKIS